MKQIIMDGLRHIWENSYAIEWVVWTIAIFAIILFAFWILEIRLDLAHGSDEKAKTE